MTGDAFLALVFVYVIESIVSVWVQSVMSHTHPKWAEVTRDAARKTVALALAGIALAIASAGLLVYYSFDVLSMVRVAKGQPLLPGSMGECPLETRIASFFLALLAFGASYFYTREYDRYCVTNMPELWNIRHRAWSHFSKMLIPAIIVVIQMM
jgi:hypothetical protein